MRAVTPSSAVSRFISSYKVRWRKSSDNRWPFHVQSLSAVYRFECIDFTTARGERAYKSACSAARAVLKPADPSYFMDELSKRISVCMENRLSMRNEESFSSFALQPQNSVLKI